MKEIILPTWGDTCLKKFLCPSTGWCFQASPEIYYSFEKDPVQPEYANQCCVSIQTNSFNIQPK